MRCANSQIDRLGMEMPEQIDGQKDDEAIV